MAYLDFFAARDDLFALFDFLFAETDMRVFDHASPVGEKLREYTSTEQIDAIHQIGLDQTGVSCNGTFTLWSPSATPIPQVKLYANSPGQRTYLNATGLMQLYLGGVQKDVITTTHFGHNEEKRARTWYGEEANLTDWVVFAKASRKIQYHIRKRLAVARFTGPSRPVLPHALRLVQQGHVLKEEFFRPWFYDTAALRAGETVTPAKWLREPE